MGRLSLWLLLLAGMIQGGCSFDGSAPFLGSDEPSDAASPTADALSIPDAEPPADALQNCIPNAKVCIDGTLETCKADGSGLDPALALDCDFACVDNDHCVQASNIDKAVADACEGNVLQLTPSAGATVNFDRANGKTVINCDPDCGDGATTQIVETSNVSVVGAPDLAVFCLSTVTIPTGLSIGALANLDDAIVWLVEGSVTIDGTMDLSGSDGTDQNAGGAGPGGGRGGVLTDDQNVNGVGPCRGLGGTRAGGSGNNVGGGGGGGGNRGNGGLGGRGQAPENGDTADGGNGGGTCGTAELTPLIGGSGGGSGGDGTGGICGWPGGGGGGAFQISSKVSITHNGSIAAHGGNGFYAPCPDGPPLGGGGGGGSGGSVLLEAPVLVVGGGLSVEGGNGATTDAGDGGLGATGGSLIGGNGTNESAPNQSGAGGGGGGGRVRLNATAQPDCGGKVSPSASCSAGTMAIHQ